MNPLQALVLSLETGFPVFALHILATLAMFFALTWIYNRITLSDSLVDVAHRDLVTAISSGSVLVSFAIPLAFCLAGSVNVLDLFIWGVPLGLTQLMIFYVTEHIFRRRSRKALHDPVPVAIYVAALRISLAFIFAGAIMD